MVVQSKLNEGIAVPRDFSASSVAKMALCSARPSVRARIEKDYTVSVNWKDMPSGVTLEKKPDTEGVLHG